MSHRIENGERVLPVGLDPVSRHVWDRWSGLARRFGLAAHRCQLTAIEWDVPERAGHAAYFDSCGVVHLREAHRRNLAGREEIRRYGAPSDERAATYRTYRDVQHELLHGLNVNRNLDQELDEALTEECAHALAVDWLLRDGLGCIVDWALDATDHPFVVGTYPGFREVLKRQLDRVGAAGRDRLSLVMEMKLALDPARRIDGLAALLAAPGRAAHAAEVRSVRESFRESEIGRDWTPRACALSPAERVALRDSWMATR